MSEKKQPARPTDEPGHVPAPPRAAGSVSAGESPDPDHKAIAESLRNFPLLVHAPDQHGPGVRTEDHGVAVDEIAKAAATVKDHKTLAERFKTSPDHVQQALKYAAAAKGK